MTRPVRQGQGTGVDRVRQRNSAQADASAFGTRSTVFVGNSGDLEIKVDDTLRVGSDGTLGAVKKRVKIGRLVDISNSLASISDNIEAFEDVASTATTVALLRSDLNDNILPALRRQISTLTAKINRIVQELE